MKKNQLQFVFLALLILVASNQAGNNTFILSGGISHSFFKAATTEQPVSKPGFFNLYSISLQYNRQISETFGAGVRSMFHNFNAFQEDGVSGTNIPVLLTMNYRLFKLVMVDNHVQLAAGPVFLLNSEEGFENQELKKSFKTGYGIGLFSGYKFNLWRALGIYVEGGLLYEKYNFKGIAKNSGNIMALLNLGFSFNY